MRLVARRAFAAAAWIVLAVPTAGGGAVFYEPGTIPLVLEVPHDGSADLPGVPRRSGGDSVSSFKTARDTGVAPLARLLNDRLEALTGARAFLVVNQVHRRYFDANRAPKDAYEHPTAAAAYQGFQEALTKAIHDARQRHPLVLILDLHRQSADPADVYFGTRRGKAVKALGAAQREALLQGPESLPASLHARGYDIPGFGDRPPHPGWSGHILKEYGSWEGVAVVQLEMHKRRLQDEASRTRFADDLAAALAGALRAAGLAPAARMRP